MRILIDNITSYKAQVIAKFIKNNYGNNVEIITIDKRSYTKIIRSKYSDSHKVYNENNIFGLGSLIKENKIDYFIPIESSSIGQYLKNKDKFCSSLSYYSKFETFDVLNDKSKLYTLAKRLEIKVPSIEDDINNVDGKYVVKPVDLSSSKGVKYFNSYKKAIEYKKKSNGNVIIQEYVQGVGIGYSVVAKNGKILKGYGHKRLAEYPVSGGSSTYRKKYADPRIKEIAEIIIKDVNWSGFAMFEFKLTPNNEVYLIEVNPRIWGSIHQGLINGVNYFEPLLGKVKIEEKNLRSYLSPLLYVSIFNYLMKLNYEPLKSFILNGKKNKADISFLDDFKGWLSFILRPIL